MSEIAVILNPAFFNAFIDEFLPVPGPFTKTDTSCIPAMLALCPTSSAALAAAYGVDFRDPLKPEAPELPENKVLPSKSVIVMSVLLNPADTKALPEVDIIFVLTFFVLLISVILSLC